MIITHETRVPTNDERRADWAQKFCLAGHHRSDGCAANLEAVSRREGEPVDDNDQYLETH